MSGLGTQYIIDKENQKLLGSITYTPNIDATTPTNEALLSVDNEYIDYSKSSDTRICYVISGTVNSGHSIYSYNINIGSFDIYDKFKNGVTIQKVNLTFQIVNQ